MKVLIYDEKDGVKLANMFQLLHANAHCEIVNNLDEAIQTYLRSKHAYIFVDYTSVDGKNFVEKVMKFNPKEKITTLNTEYECFNKHQCDNCEFNMLIKPLSLEQLSQYLSLEKCNCFKLNTFEFKVEKISRSISHIHPNLRFEFDRQNHIFSSGNFTTTVLETFSELFQENNLTYNLLNHKQIELVQHA